jgi:D-alanyl-D-alanine carboxypeptidase (penicillin-binding protein 5/6)
MFKRLSFILIPIFFLSIVGFSKRNIYLTAESALLMDPWSKRIIYSKNPHQKLAPASTIKIMTALIALKKSDLKKRVVVSKLAASMEPSKVYLKEGEGYFVDDLAKAVLLNSSNDASVALAEGIAGSQEKFVKAMNDMTDKLGARNTNFRNSSGLPAKNQYSTAYDLALIVRSAMKNKRFTEIIKIKETEIKELESGRRIKLRNHNKSLWKEKPYSIYGKTGYTIKAKHCFAGYIEYKKKKLIVVILRSKKPWLDLEALAERGR